MSIFDVTTEIDRANIGKDLEQFIADTIRAAFVENADDHQNVQGLRVQAGTHTKGAALNIKSDVHDLMDIIVRALTVYKSRITPVFYKVEYIEGAEDFALEAEQRAREDLTPEDFDNLIEITVHDGDKLIPPEKIRIGEIVTIKANGQSWQSVLTGYEKTQNTHKFVFGYVRVDLDKILRIERRARA